MTKKCLLSLFLMLICTAAFGQESRNAIRDASFERGINIAAPSPLADTVCGAMLPDSTKTAVWTLRQYNSKFNMAAFSYEKWMGKHIYTLAGNGNMPAKVVTINPKAASLTLECNASAEYTGIRRKDQPWIYMTVDAPTDTVLLGLCKGLKLSFNGKISSWEDCMGPLADKAVHASTCVFSLRLRNVNRESRLWGRTFTIAMILFDNRLTGSASEPIVLEPDLAAEGEFVYCPQSALYIGGSGRLPKARQAFTVSADMLQIVSTALKEAREDAAIGDSYPAEWEIVGCSFGWEMTGTYNAALELSNLNLTVSR